LMLGQSPRELDVVVEGDIGPLLRTLGGEQVVHERFETASVLLGEARLDIARARRERYREAGALPDVEPATLIEDLARRDFTVNAIALELAGEARGALRHAPNALEDLTARRLRVLHQASFFDDPTRLWRLGRYAARLGFEPAHRTAALAGRALDEGAMTTISGARIGAELRLALEEADAVGTLGRLDELGVLASMHRGVRVGHEHLPILRAAAELLPADGRVATLLWIWIAFLAGGGGHAAVGAAPESSNGERRDGRALLDWLELRASERDPVLRGAHALPRLVGCLAREASPVSLFVCAERLAPEAVALAGAIGREEPAPSDTVAAARSWLERWRHVRLEITGEDLIAAGIPQGPEI
ncbi:MAG: tRNA nucleotidyltransferase/poly(A) polymerase family protein, partial [Solirubrobacteraceae bacterium]